MLSHGSGKISKIERDNSDSFSIDSLEDEKSIKLEEEREESLPLYGREVKLSEVRELKKRFVGGSVLRKQKVIGKREEDALRLNLNDLPITFRSNVSTASLVSVAAWGKQKTKPAQVKIRERGRSMSYLEHYRNRVEWEMKQRRTDSVCSMVGTELSPRSVFSSDDLHHNTNTTSDEEQFRTEESLYSDILAGVNGHSTSRLINSSHSWTMNGADQLDLKKSNSYRTNRSNSTRNSHESRRKVNSCQEVLPIVKLPKSLGPDLEQCKPKLDRYLKRKEYGNRASRRNRLAVLQNRETAVTNIDDNHIHCLEDVVVVPVVSYRPPSPSPGQSVPLKIGRHWNSRRERFSSVNVNAGAKSKKASLSNERRRRGSKNVDTSKNMCTSGTGGVAAIEEKRNKSGKESTRMMLERHLKEAEAVDFIRRQLEMDCKLTIRDNTNEDSLSVCSN